MASLNGTQTSVKGSNKSKKGKGRVGGNGKKREALAIEQRLAAERTALLAEKQTELEGVLDSHDTLVRESFQLEKFVTMLLYDPAVSKTDNSAVWREYKSNHDLLEQAHTTSTEGPSARTTRRAHTERLQQFKAIIVDASPMKAVKPKQKQSTADPIWSIIAGATGKGAEKPEVTNSPLSRKGKGKEREKPPISPRTSSRTIRAIPADPIVEDCADSISQAGNASPTPTQSGPGRPTRKRPSGGDTESISTNGHSLLVMDSARKKRRWDAEPSKDMPPPPPPVRSSRRLRDDAHLSISAGPTTHVPGQLRVNGKSFSRQSQSFAPLSTPLPASASMKSGITRIKLIVRRPPTPITNPRQRPPAPSYGSSVDKFFASYTTVNDQDFLPGSEALNDLAQSDSIILDRVDSLRAQGRFAPQVDTDESDAESNTADVTATDSREPDVWDRVIEEAIARRRAMRRNGGSRFVAAQVASKVQGYWDGHAQKEDKAKAQEERRLRLLAKATIKIVTAEWKKAVFHIRDQERQILEAEERRIGQTHLDAILDQSGHILETQQGDLAKGDLAKSRSRSSSVSATMRDWGMDSDDEDDEEVDENMHGSDASDEEEDDFFPQRITEETDADDSDDGPILDDDDVEIPAADDGRESAVATPHSVSSTLPDTSDVELQYPSEGSSPPNAIAQLAGEYDHQSSTNPSDIAGIDVVRDAASVDHLPGYSSPSHSSLAPVQELDEPSLDHDVGMYLEDDVDRAGHDAMEATSPQSSIHGTEEPQLSTPAVMNATLPEFDCLADSHVHSPSPHVPLAAASEQSSATQLDLVSGEEQQEYPTGEVDEDLQEGYEDNVMVPEYLKPFAVAPVEWNPETKVRPPILLRGTLRPYQQSGLEWLASLHTNNLNGILADEMGLGKTIQTISLLAHLACDQGIWGPHLIIVPTSVLLNWEMEFKKFLPGFKTLSYHGTTKRRKELRQGWNDKHHFNVCITSYTLASRDAHIFKRKAWYYMILDEAHMIKNFKSQRWNILLMFRSFRRLLLTGTPLQNNLTELWALLQFLMSGTNFANLKEFGEWFSNPLEKAIEMGTVLDDENMQRVSKLHTVLRPYLLRRLKRDVEKELPSKYDHLVLCPLSKRQRFLYDEFMLRAQTRESLQSGVYQKIANILMQLRKVCNHPDLFEVRPIVTSFAMTRSAIADFEISELLVRRRLLQTDHTESINLDVLGLHFIDRQGMSIVSALETQFLDASNSFPLISQLPENPPPRDTRSINGFKEFMAYNRRAATVARWAQVGYLNRLRCNRLPIYSRETLALIGKIYQPLLPLSSVDARIWYMERLTPVSAAIKSYCNRAHELSSTIEKFAFVTPAAVALDMPRLALLGHEATVAKTLQDPTFDEVLHQPSVKLQIAFPDPSLLQFDCGKLQKLTSLLREKKAGGHRVLIFTQMTKILDILEIFLNFHGYLYLRLDGATKIEDRQYITERFNADSRVFCFIASSRSGGVGINLTGADTVVFYDSDFNPQMDRQCEDRAHRIGQIRDVHIYRFVSSHTVEEAMLLKANQKRSLDDLVIQKGEFDWRSLFGDESVLSKALDETALTKALGEVEDTEDAHAAAVAAREAVVIEGADEADFGGDPMEAESGEIGTLIPPPIDEQIEAAPGVADVDGEEGQVDHEEEDEEGGTTVDYMLAFVRRDEDFFQDWRL